MLFCCSAERCWAASRRHCHFTFYTGAVCERQRHCCQRSKHLKGVFTQGTVSPAGGLVPQRPQRRHKLAHGPNLPRAAKLPTASVKMPVEINWIQLTAPRGSRSAALQQNSALCKRGLRAHLHQCGAGPPVGAGSVFRKGGRVFTLARVHAQFHFTGAPFRGTGSLIYKYRPIGAPIPAGPAEESLRERSLRASRGGRAGPRRCKQHHTIPSNRSTAEPARAPRAFSA